MLLLYEMSDKLSLDKLEWNLFKFLPLICELLHLGLINVKGVKVLSSVFKSSDLKILSNLSFVLWTIKLFIDNWCLNKFFCLFVLSNNLYLKKLLKKSFFFSFFESKEFNLEVFLLIFSLVILKLSFDNFFILESLFFLK